MRLVPVPPLALRKLKRRFLEEIVSEASADRFSSLHASPFLNQTAHEERNQFLFCPITQREGSAPPPTPATIRPAGGADSRGVQRPASLDSE